MGIGTSKGAFYDDQFHYSQSQWDDKYDDNVITPSKQRTDKSLDESELDPSSGLGIEVNYKPPVPSIDTEALLKPAERGGPPLKLPEVIARSSNPYIGDITNEDVDKAINIGLSAGPGIMAGIGSKTASEASRWFKGSDKMPRYEISDEGMKLVDRDWKFGDVGKLHDFVEHPKLFEAYPDLKDMNFEVAPKDYGYLGSYNKVTNTLKINPSKIPAGDEGLLDTINHELQHWVQGKEGFAEGSTPDRALGKALLSLGGKIKQSTGPEKEELTSLFGDIWNKMHEFRNYMYLRTPGEVEANAVAARRKLTDKQREAFPVEDMNKILEGSTNSLHGGTYVPEFNYPSP